MIRKQKHLFYIILALIIAYPVFMTALPGCGGGGGGGFTVTPAPTFTSVPQTPAPEPESGVKYAYVSAIDEDCVYVFDADNFTFVTKMTGLSMADQMCFSKSTKRTDGGPKYLYVANFTDVKRFNLSTQARDTDWVSPCGIAIGNVQITPDDKYLYAVDGVGSGPKIMVVNVDTESEVSTSPIVMPVGSTLTNVSITPDGSKLVVGDSGFGPPAGYHIPLVRASDNTIYATILTLLGRTSQAFTHPNGSYAYVVMPWSNKVAIVNINTQSVAGTVDVGAYPFYMVISPDGNYGYVTNCNDSTISVLQLNGAEATEILPRIAAPDINGSSGISADGKYLWIPGYDKIYVVDTTTKLIVKTLEGPLPSDGYVGFAHVLVE